jgi:hypothetical protein
MVVKNFQSIFNVSNLVKQNIFVAEETTQHTQVKKTTNKKTHKNQPNPKLVLGLFPKKIVFPVTLCIFSGLVFLLAWVKFIELQQKDFMNLNVMLVLLMNGSAFAGIACLMTYEFPQVHWYISALVGFFAGLLWSLFERFLSGFHGHEAANLWKMLGALISLVGLFLTIPKFENKKIILISLAVLAIALFGVGVIQAYRKSAPNPAPLSD